MVDLDFASNLILTFFIFSFAGWLFEGAISLFRDRELVNRGFLNGPYCPIYGFGALFFILLMQWTDRPLELFFFGALSACTLEYITSWLMEKIYKARWWDYNNWPFNLNGRVCLYSFLTFGVFASIMPLMKGGIDKLLALIPEHIRGYIALILVILFALDFLYSNHVVISFNETLRKIQKEIAQHFPLNIVNRGRRSYLYLRFMKKEVRLLTWQQRRILKAFPNLKSKHAQALSAIQKQHKKTMSKFQKNRFKPITEKELATAKAKARKQGKKQIQARKSNKY